MSVLAESTNITAQTFYTALVTNAGLLILQLGAFVLLKQKLGRIYSPRTYLPPPGKRAIELPKGLWRWLPALIMAPSEDIIRKNGLDAYMFLRFIKILIWIFLVFTILTSAIILPVDTVNVSNTQPGLDRFTWSNISASGNQSRYAAHISLAYLFTFFVIILIRHEMLKFVHLRQQFLISKSHSRLARARTVLITSVPDELANEHDMLRFASFVPGGVDRVWFYRDTKVLNKLFAERESACDHLEAAASSILRQALSVWQDNVKKRQEDEERGGNIDHPPQPSREFLEQLVPHASWPSHRTGILGILGRSVNTFEYCKTEISRLNLLIEETRQHLSEGRFLGSAFVHCNLQMGAHVLAQCVSYQEPSKMDNKWLEAHPKDIVWANLDDDEAESPIRFVISWAATAGLIVVWAFPVAFIGSLSNVTSLCGKFSWLQFVCKAPVIVKGIIQGVLPPLLLAILFILVPYILRALAHYESIPRHSLISISLYRRFFLFLVIHGFLVVTLTSGITKAIKDILRSPASTIQALATRLPGASTFFLTYMITQGLAGAGTALVQLASLVFHFIQKWWMDWTPRQAFDVTFMMPSVDFGVVMPMFSLLATIGFTYSIISPLINVLALISYACLYLAWKFLFLQVFDQPYEFETGGLYFPVALSYLFVGLYVEQVCLACLFALRIPITRLSSILETVLMIVLLIITIFSHIVLNGVFRPITKYLPMSLATVKVANKYEQARNQNGGLADEIEEEVDMFRRDVKNVEREISALSSKVRDDVVEAVEDIEINVDGNRKTREEVMASQSSALPQDVPDLFVHLSSPGKEMKGKHSLRHRRPRWFRHHPKDANSPPRAGKDAEGDNYPSDDEDDFDEHAFDHPSTYRPQRWIWVPKDTLGLSVVLVDDLISAGVAASDLGARINDQGVVHVTRTPPDERWKGGVDN